MTIDDNAFKVKKGLLVEDGELLIRNSSTSSEVEHIVIRRESDSSGNVNAISWEEASVASANDEYAQIQGVITNASGGAIDGDLRFLVAGANSLTEVMRIEGDTGFIGIGDASTATPAYLVDIDDGQVNTETGGSGLLHIRNSTSGNAASILFTTASQRRIQISAIDNGSGGDFVIAARDAGGGSVFNEGLRVQEDGSVKISTVYTLPAVSGSSNQILQNDGNGNVSWQDSFGDSNISGSNNYVSRFKTGGGLKNSTIRDNGTTVTITKGLITSPGAGTNSEKFGASTTAAGTRALAVGFGASASAQESVAIGDTATASQADAIAIGDASTASGIDGIAIGDTATASNTDAIGIGRSALADNLESICIGRSSQSGGNRSIAIGAAADAAGANTVAIGYNNVNNNTSGVAIGPNIVQGGNSYITLGNSITNQGSYGIAFGGAGTGITSGHTACVVFNGASTASRQIVFGGANELFYSSDMYLAGGVTSINTTAGARNFRINATGGSGTNKRGADILIAGGKGTGKGDPGSIKFQTSTKLGTGSTLQSLTTRLEVLSGGATRFNRAFTFPTTDGSANQVLTTDGAGIVTWEDGGSSISGSPDTITRYNSSGNKYRNSSIRDNGTDVQITNGADFYVHGTGGTPNSSLRLGLDARATGNFGVAVGTFADALNSSAIAIGYNSEASTSTAMAIGRNSIASGATSQAIGYEADATGTYSVSLGNTARSLHTASICIGFGAISRATKQLVIGRNGVTYNITDVYIGNGVYPTTGVVPEDVTYHASGGSTSDANARGASIILAGGKGTGAGAPGGVKFQTSTKLGSGSTVQSLTTRLEVLSGGATRFNKAFTFPKTDGSADQVLTTNGAGIVTWEDGGSSISGSPNYHAKYNAAGDATINSLISDDGTDITAFGDFIPSVDNTYSLGTSAAQWKDLYVSGSTIYINNKAITEAGGQLSFEGSLIATSASLSGAVNTATGTDSIGFGEGSTDNGNANSSILGPGANTTGTSSVAIGHDATAAQTAIAIGEDATANTTNCIAIGENSTSSGSNSIAIGSGVSSGNGANSIVIGRNAFSNNGDTIAIGVAATIGSGFGESILLGNSATNTAMNQFVAGSSTMPMNEIYFGKGVTNATATDYTINGTGGSGTDNVGGTLKLAGGRGTGTGIGGQVILQVAPISGSSAILNQLDNRLRATESGVFFYAGSSAPADGDFAPSEVAFWLDESNNEFELKGKKSDGTAISSTVIQTFTGLTDTPASITDGGFYEGDSSGDLILSSLISNASGVLGMGGSIDMNGNVLFLSGTASHLGVQFEGDGNTGIKRIGNDTFAITTAGTDILQFGVLEILPKARLKATFDGTEANPLYRWNSSASGLYCTTASDILHLVAGGAEYIRLDDSTGRVGIGTKSVDNDVHIAGTDNSDSVAILKIEKNTSGTSSDEVVERVVARSSSSTASGMGSFTEYGLDNDGSILGRIGARRGTAVADGTLVLQAFETGVANTEITLNGQNGNIELNTQQDSGLIKILGDTDTNLFVADADNNKVGIGTSTPNSKLEVNGTVSLATVGISGSVNTTDNDVIYFVRSDLGTYTLTLLSAEAVDGRTIIVKDEGGNAGTNNITVATQGSETIDGSATQVISTNYGVLRLISNGTDWFLI